MSITSVNIRMDSELKQKFEAFCADVGLTMTAAFTVFARQSVRENRIPFEIRGELPNKQTREALEEAQRLKANPSIAKSYSTAEEMMKDLLDDA